MTYVRYALSAVCSVAVLMLASRLQDRPSPPPRGPLPLNQMASITGGSENGGGCATLEDTTSCKYTAPEGYQSSLDLCPRDADFMEKKQAFMDGCQGFNTGVGPVETAGPPLKPNTNEVQAAGKAACEADYAVTFGSGEGVVEGCIPAAVRLTCDRSFRGKPTSYVDVCKCNDP
jgi:hypothetical protein